ncbi:NAD(P)-dependent dehydrogenase (short-subunit alcohol dehydrogenase family) [Actinocorallia herbida]|uniref:NAD(P)-dependent dehydrogenase (Short-subunit alcohol dehydrogenase family) n=1 Tax=Actinocorallia herbida TaxID=58109 RepID=A0A3N1D6B1_9ACTN|nr:SDR family oxidoreductase [Actinocorallia herbida]ROO89072.1 NAD(P)-dependent dehydrogenase (short-subunit alcohol dehydrogenase family) [Actinocorallia herbida]
MELELTGRTALVTGGSSGIGLATVASLLAEGANVATCGRDPERLRTALAPLREQYGDRLYTGTADVTDAETTTAFVASAVAHFGGLDVLVNNAGRSHTSTFKTTTDDAWRAEVDLKFFGVINPTRAALEALRASDAAAIVNLNAVLARQPEPHLVATSAARAGLLNLSTSMAAEFAADGIRVNSVCVGLIDTGQWRRRYDTAVEEGRSPGSYDEWARSIAANRRIAAGRFGTAEEVAAAVVFLASPRASYVTGTQLEVSGGVARYV